MSDTTENIQPQEEMVMVSAAQLEKLILQNKQYKDDLRTIMFTGKQITDLIGLKDGEEMGIMQIMGALPKLKKNAHIFEQVPVLIEKYSYLLGNESPNPNN